MDNESRQNPGKPAAVIGIRDQVCLEVRQILEEPEVEPRVDVPGRREETIVLTPQYEDWQQEDGDHVWPDVGALRKSAVRLSLCARRISRCHVILTRMVNS